MDFRFLRQPVEGLDPLRANSRYFTEADEGYSYTDFYKYKMARSAAEYFKALVFKLDNRSTDGKGLYSYDKEDDYIDQEATSKNRGPYADKFLLFEEQWQAYKKQNLDQEFKPQESIENTDSEELGLSEFNPSISCSLDEAIQAYYCASEILARYDKKKGDRYDSLPKSTKYVSKDEYKEKHEIFRKQLREKLGLPEDDTFKVYKHEIRPRMKPGKRPEATDDSKFQEYSKEFTKFIIND